MQIRLLGGFEVLIDGRQVPPTDWRRRQAAGLVKLLALATGRMLHREQVIDALWPNLSVSQAAPRLHKAAHYARRALRQPRSLVLSGDTVALFPDAELDIDAMQFQRLAESARDAKTADAAADAYPGDLLPHDRYEAWTEEPRERLRLLHLRMLRRAGRWHDVVSTDPTDEPAHLRLVRGLATAGDTQSALGQLERLERGLRELNVGPSPEVVRLREDLVDSLRRGRAEIVVVGPATRPGQPTIRSDGDQPYRHILEMLAELCRYHPALSARAAPIAVVIV
jgi:DNA-binding SARP family transcriptional activator